MATTADPGGPSIPAHHVPLGLASADTDVDDDAASPSISSSSDSLSYNSDLPNDLSPAPVRCRWRTPQFHDRECLRYFDCPTHLVERALSDAGGPEGAERAGEHHGEEGGAVEEAAHSPPQPSPRAVSPLSEGEEGHRERPRAPSPLPEEGTTEVAVEGGRDGSFGQHDAAAAGGTGSGSGSGSGSGEGPSALASLPEPALRTRTASTSSPSAAARLPPVPAIATRPSPVPSPSPTEHAIPPEVVLPRWQPDSEVTYCPICGTQFSIFVRKHHCRKCGRVVCNSCSPHRITIPHQYIVRPPGTPRPLTHAPSLSMLDSQGWYPEFGGGERVRLCNPCVPDPNVAPPQTPPVDQPRSPTGSAAQADNTTLASRWGFYFGAGGANDAQTTRSRSATMHHASPTPPRPLFPPPTANETRILWGTPPAYYRPSSSSHPTRLYPGTAPRYRPMVDASGASSSSAIAGPSSPGPSSGHRRPHHHPAFAPPPRPQIAEEDECPICHRELPPRSLMNFEALREAHITSCITTHSRYGGGGGSSSAAARGDNGSGGGPDELPPMPPRRTGMFPYVATEKDCVDSAECSICLEEFEVGVAMARLECLCRFHRACINAWWERHPGRCPMHQHDGFGY